MESLKDALKNIPDEPGVYHMLDSTGKILYVGKAKRLYRRVNSYFQRQHPDEKTRVLVSKIAALEVTVTRSDYEALLLESNLIKQHRPPYNVIFRDDKSYPFLHISAGEFPRIVPYRGARKKTGETLGPFPDMSSLRENLTFLQKTFRFRQCEDSVFKHRRRPCLQYQIARCTAPCVNFISAQDYQERIQQVKAFFQGKDAQIVSQLEAKMQMAAEAMDFEQAAIYRDQIRSLQKLRAPQSAVAALDLDIDFLALKRASGVVVITLLPVRQGKMFGTRHIWPEHVALETDADILAAFIEHYYVVGMGQALLPKEIIAEIVLPEKEALRELLGSAHGRSPQLKNQVRGQRAEWLQLAVLNAEQALQVRLSQQQTLQQQWQALCQFLKLPQAANRIECFDISHTSGQQAVASCVVWNAGGAQKSVYRRFNMVGITPGDDYAALFQALKRRYARLQTEGKTLPDIVLIDGGPAQLKQVCEVWQQLSLPNSTCLMSVSKGPARKAGWEKLWLQHQHLPITLNESDPALHLIQQVRDEAHRFAIFGHRRQREKSSIRSKLLDIPGVGPAKAKALLNFFGGWQLLAEASIEQIAQVEGVSVHLAQEIYQSLRS